MLYSKALFHSLEESHSEYTPTHTELLLVLALISTSIIELQKMPWWITGLLGIYQTLKVEKRDAKVR